MTDADSHPYRRRVYRIRNDDDRTLSETLEAILEVGCSYLEVSNGHVKRTFPDRGVHRVVAADGPPEVAAAGDVHAHARTYCRRTLERDSPLALSNAAADGWGDDPAYETHGLACYVGTAIEVGDADYGTVCFVSEAARDREFDATDLAFVEFVGRVVETELTVHEYTRKLRNRDKLLATLNRVLRHNLRNDMNVIRGTAHNLRKRLNGESEREASVIVDKATGLVKLGADARAIDRLLEDDTPPEPREVVPMVEAVAEDLRAEGPTGTVDVSAGTRPLALASEHVRAALSELGENALRNAGEAPTVEFAVDETGDDTATVAISDDGPGLPPSERAILRGAEETQVEHGQGLGLWLVYWAVADVGGHVTVDVDDGTTVTLHLPQVDDDADASAWTTELYLDRATLW